MGREIRRVPEGWEHPRDNRGHYQPMFDRDFEMEATKWVNACTAWAAGTHPDQVRRSTDAPPLPAYFWEWDGGPPERAWYRPAFTTEPTHYQFYETVSEGTPLSPVFASLAELEDWLVNEAGYSREGAHGFCESGWAPSFMRTADGAFINGVEASAR